jgi:hypothetical protein
MKDRFEQTGDRYSLTVNARSPRWPTEEYAKSAFSYDLFILLQTVDLRLPFFLNFCRYRSAVFLFLASHAEIVETFEMQAVVELRRAVESLLCGAS